MTQSIVVSQGKNFTVELQSMHGSSAYGWCLSILPKGIILLGTDIYKATSPYPIGPVIQKFYFAAVSGNPVLTLEFVLTAAFRPEDIKDIYTVEVQIVPENPQQFVPYDASAQVNKPFLRNSDMAVNKPFLNDADAMKTAMPYGMVYVDDAAAGLFKYGFPNC